jgi:hypothetical protein
VVNEVTRNYVESIQQETIFLNATLEDNIVGSVRGFQLGDTFLSKE